MFTSDLAVPGPCPSRLGLRVYGPDRETRGDNCKVATKVMMSSVKEVYECVE